MELHGAFIRLDSALNKLDSYLQLMAIPSELLCYSA